MSTPPIPFRRPHPRAPLLALLAATTLLPACARSSSGAAEWEGNSGLELVDASADDLRRLVRAGGARATLVNLWATWCDPCREELPDLLRLRAELAPSGLRVALVSADAENRKEAAIALLHKLGADFRTWRISGDGLSFVEAHQRRWNGALPATLVFDGAGKLVHFREGRLHEAELRGLLEPLLQAGAGR